MNRKLIPMVCSALLCGVLANAGTASGSISREQTADGTCETNNYGPTAFYGDGDGGITNHSSVSWSSDCSFVSIYSVSDLTTATYAEVDLHNHAGAASTAKACARSYWSSTYSCGNAASTGTGTYDGQMALDISAWTAAGSNGYYPYINLRMSPASTIWGFYFVTN